MGAPFAWAARNELIPANPAEGIPRFSGQSKKRDILTEDERRSLVALDWPDKRAGVAFLVALTTEARLGEINALQLRDVGEDRLYIGCFREGTRVFCEEGSVKHTLIAILIWV